MTAGDMSDNADVSLELTPSAAQVRSEDPVESLADVTEEQQAEAEAFALIFLKEVLRLRGVSIDRDRFLKAELHKRGVESEVVAQAIAGTPVGAGVSLSLLDEIASSSIRFETQKSSALSFAAGLPGGFAMVGTIPGDITQFYVHAFRVMQKLAYVYGWQALLEDAKDVDDETLGKLASLLGVMMGVGAASGAVTAFAANVARPAVQKQVAKVALTKTVWYTPLKQVLRIVGIKLTKQTLASTVAKVVPVVGGVVSGGMTMVMLDSQSKRLMGHLRSLPPPNVDVVAYLSALRELDDQDDPPSPSPTRWATSRPALPTSFGPWTEMGTASPTMRQLWRWRRTLRPRSRRDSGGSGTVFVPPGMSPFRPKVPRTTSSRTRNNPAGADTEMRSKTCK